MNETRGGLCAKRDRLHEFSFEATSRFQQYKRRDTVRERERERERDAPGESSSAWNVILVAASQRQAFRLDILVGHRGGKCMRKRAKGDDEREEDERGSCSDLN